MTGIAASRRYSSFFEKIPILLISWIVVCAPILTTDYLIEWDSYYYVYPKLIYLVDHFRQWEFPLWNPWYLSGNAFFAEVSGFPYPIIAVVLALLPESVNSHYAFEVCILLLCLAGSLGVQYFLILCRVRRDVAGTVAALSLVMYGPLIGQPAILWSIVALPWLLILFDRALMNCRSSLHWQSIAAFSLAAGLTQLQAYFATQLFNAVFLFLYGCFMAYDQRLNRVETGRLLVVAMFMLLGVLGVAAVYLIPAAENRIFYYGWLDGDFVSPDPVLRGLSPGSTYAVGLFEHVYGFFSLILGFYKINAITRHYWVMGFGLVPVLLMLFSLLSNPRSARLWFFTATGALFFLYAMGTANPVYRVSLYLPVLDNIRYPIFSFYLFQLCGLLVIALGLTRYLDSSASQSRVPLVVWTVLCLVTLTGLVMLVVEFHFQYLLVAAFLILLVVALWSRRPASIIVVVLVDL